MSGRLLAWCSGATLGLVVGALLGDAVRTDAELRAARRRLSRPETGASVTVRRSGGLAGENRPDTRPDLEAALSGARWLDQMVGTGGPDRKEDADTEVDA